MAHRAEEYLRDALASWKDADGIRKTVLASCGPSGDADMDRELRLRYVAGNKSYSVIRKQIMDFAAQCGAAPTSMDTNLLARKDEKGRLP